MKNSIDAAHTNKVRIGQAQDELMRLGRAAQVMGQEKLAQKLFQISSDIMSSATDVSHAVADDLTAHVEETEQATKNMMLAAMAGSSRQ